MHPHAQSPHTSSDEWKTIRTLLPYLWAYKGRVLASLFFLAIAKLASVSIPWALKGVVDGLDASQQTLIVLPLSMLLAYGVLRIITAVFNELRDVIFARVTQRAIRNIATQVFSHLHKLSLRFHLDRKTGGMSRDIERGTRGISFLLSFMLFNILPTLLEIGLIAVILFINFDAWFAIITLASVSTYILYTMWITEWRMQYRRAMNDLDSKANTRAIDSLLNYETVKYFGNEGYEACRYDEQLQQWEGAAIKNQTSLSVLNAGQGIIIAIGMTLLLWLAADGVAKGEMTLGDLVLINTYLIQLFMPLNFLGFVYREIKNSLADMERMFYLMKEPAEIRDIDNAPDLKLSGGCIRFDKVDFSYDPERRILHEIDFEIPPGQKIAVVGSSGAGKSTLSRLLFRFYNVDAGRILIDDQDIAQVNQTSLREAIGIVPQDTVLFNDTILYNIQYARPEASLAEVQQAATMAHIHHFIESLPQGYQSLVGERGLKLSGGEKQRIAIARAILKRPRILVFDEATSSLDSQAEQAILAALKELAANHTTLVIAHRLSTIVDADQILVMEQGKIIERGSHAELLSHQGPYATMWALQQAEQAESKPVQAP